MTLPDVLSELLRLNEPVPRPLRRASSTDIERAESSLGRPLPGHYREFLLRAGHVCVGTLEPASVSPDAGNLDLVAVAERGWASGVPNDELPICEDNADYYCLRPDGTVRFWSHNGPTSESWPDLDSWIRQVWIAESGGVLPSRLTPVRYTDTMLDRLLNRDPLDVAMREVMAFGPRRRIDAAERLAERLPASEKSNITALLEVCRQVEHVAYDLAAKRKSRLISHAAAVSEITQRFPGIRKRTAAKTLSQGMYFHWRDTGE